MNKNTIIVFENICSIYLMKEMSKQLQNTCKLSYMPNE